MIVQHCGGIILGGLFDPTETLLQKISPLDPDVMLLIDVDQGILQAHKSTKLHSSIKKTNIKRVDNDPLCDTTT